MSHWGQKNYVNEKFAMTPSGIEPAISWLVAQCLNQHQQLLKSGLADEKVEKCRRAVPLFHAFISCDPCKEGIEEKNCLCTEQPGEVKSPPRDRVASPEITGLWFFIC